MWQAFQPQDSPGVPADYLTVAAHLALITRYPAELNLPPESFLRGLTGHYLHAVLNEVLYSSLMAENRMRQVHMDSALQRLDEDSARLKLTYNIQRQEEITEEIEVILLSADMLNPVEW